MSDAVRGGAADAVKSIDLLLSDRHLFVAADCETMPRKCECLTMAAKIALSSTDELPCSSVDGEFWQSQNIAFA